MPAGDNNNIGRLAGREVRSCRIEILGYYLLCLGKTFAVRVGFAIIHYRDVEASDTCDLIKACSDVTCAENIKIRWRENRLHENLKRPAADETSIVFGILVQIECEGAWLLRFHDFARGLPDFGLNASATDGSDDGAIVSHQHFRRFERRNGSAHVDNGRDCSAMPGLVQLDDLFVEVHLVDYGAGVGGRSNTCCECYFRLISAYQMFCASVDGLILHLNLQEHP